MTKVALDASAYYHSWRGNTTLQNELATATNIGIPIVALGEIYYGIYNGNLSNHDQRQVEQFLATPRVEILQPDNTTANLFGEIATELRQLGRPIQQNDIWIAALCKQYGYALATADADFKNIIGLPLILY